MSTDKKSGPASGVTAIIPALNAARFLPDCLAALASSQPSPDLIFVFDDGSEDDTAQSALGAATIIKNVAAPVGPGLARNRAAALARSELLLFVDADVVVHPEALCRLRAALEEPGVVAAFGSYDDRPPGRGIPSQYANLRHHFTHQGSPPFASTFWAGLGMVRRDAFAAAGGFSAAYGRPSIEDIELGGRLIANGGLIRVVRDAKATHLKTWSLFQLWRTDILQRAVPWARLIAEKRSSDGGLNGAPRERLAAVLANCTVIALLGALLLPVLLVAVVVMAFAYLTASAPFFRFLSKRMKPIPLLGAVLLHFLYHLYASQILAWTIFWQRLRPSRRTKS